MASFLTQKHWPSESSWRRFVQRGTSTEEQVHMGSTWSTFSNTSSKLFYRYLNLFPNISKPFLCLRRNARVSRYHSTKGMAHEACRLRIECLFSWGWVLHYFSEAHDAKSLSWWNVWGYQSRDTMEKNMSDDYGPWKRPLMKVMAAAVVVVVVVILFVVQHFWIIFICADCADVMFPCLPSRVPSWVF